MRNTVPNQYIQREVSRNLCVCNGEDGLLHQAAQVCAAIGQLKRAFASFRQLV
jgi:hypothetical protein